MTAVADIAAMVPGRGDDNILVAIDGVDGAGKSMFAAALAAALRADGRVVIEASVDGFHRMRADRYRLGPNSAEGFWLDSFDYAALRTSLIEPLLPGGTRRYRRATHDVASDELLSLPWLTAAPGSVLVLDGLFLHRPELRDLWDFSVFLDLPFEVSVARLAERDGSHPDPGHPSNERYVGAQSIYIRHCSPLSRATVVVDNTDFGNPVVRGLAVREDGVSLRRAVIGDVAGIVALLADDPIGAAREEAGLGTYLSAFAAVDADPGELLVVAVDDGGIVGTLQLSFLPGLSRGGSLRAQIEAVRVAAGRRGSGIGRWMFGWAIAEAGRRGCALVQLTADNQRTGAHGFYASLGFTPSHVGFKLAL